MGKQKTLLVCTKGKSCPKMGSRDIFHFLKDLISDCELDDFYKLKKADCFDLCKHAPVLKIRPDRVSYGHANRIDAVSILLHHAKKKKPLKDLFALVGKKRKK